MQVLVAGGGIGGLALAAGLCHDGHDVTVLEAAPTLRTDGAAVTLYGNGHAAMAALGLPEVPLPGVGGRFDELVVRLADGRPVSRTDLTPLADRSGYPVVATPRAELLVALAAALPDRVLHLGTAVAEVHVVDNAVEVRDSHGTIYRPELLVGADGVGSVVRAATVGVEPAREVGWTTWQGLSRVVPGIAESGSGLLTVGAAGMCGILPAGAGRTQWWFDVRNGPPVADRTNALGFLREHFAGWAAPVDELLATVRSTDLAGFAHVVHRIPRQWGVGPTTLLGDAAHAFPPSQAQGANQALEDAYVLSREVRRAGDPADLARTYERERRRRVRRVSRLAARETTMRVPPPPVRAVMHHMTPATAGRLYSRMLGRWSSVLADY